MSKYQVRKVSLSLERLEDRLAPAQGNLPWPITLPPNQALDLFSTYGQFSDAGGLHSHEGIDIVAPAGTQVKAVEAGTVRFVVNDIGTPFVSKIVIESINHGWNYVHIVPGMSPVTKAAWQPTDLVAAGDILGTVAVPGATFPAHLHLDYTAITVDPNFDYSSNLRPIDDPLYHLALRDTTKPTVDPDFRFRTAATDTSPPLPNPAITQLRTETPPTNHAYSFQRDWANRLIIGKRAITQDSNSNLYNGSAEIDLVVNAYDQFIASGRKVGVKGIGFQAKANNYRGNTGLEGTQEFADEFTHQNVAPLGHHYASLRDFHITRSAYEHDATSTSTHGGCLLPHAHELQRQQPDRSC